MPITIETVPESIPFERVQELVRSLGLETRDLVSLCIDRQAVTAEVAAYNAEGKRYLIGHGDDARVATHQIVIPVTPSPQACPSDCDTSDACRSADSHVGASS